MNSAFMYCLPIWAVLRYLSLRSSKPSEPMSLSIFFAQWNKRHFGYASVFVLILSGALRSRVNPNLNLKALCLSTEANHSQIVISLILQFHRSLRFVSGFLCVVPLASHHERLVEH